MTKLNLNLVHLHKSKLCLPTVSAIKIQGISPVDE
jgi:hypothetical protein